MKIICAYCNTVMSPGDSPGDPVSHGLCDQCSQYVLSDLGVDITKYFDMLGAPVFLLNQDVRLLGGSYEGARYIGKPLDELMNCLAGDVFGCRNASLPGGCGKTVCCSGCVIRSTVRKTFETGEPANRLPAVLVQGTGINPEPVNLLISTRKAGPAVILKVEPAGSGPSIPSAV